MFLDGKLVSFVNGLFYSVRNKASPSDNECLKLLGSGWFENLSDKLFNSQLICQGNKKWQVVEIKSFAWPLTDLWSSLADFETSQSELFRALAGKYLIRMSAA